MDYQQLYNDIIQKAKSQNRQKGQGVYYEKHHITPKCVGGTNDQSNLVLLTAREHFICHKLLVEIYDHNSSLVAALWMMSFAKTYNRGYRVGAREYERLRKQFIENFSGENHPMFGKTPTEETRKKLSEARIGKNFSEEHKRNLSNSNRGKKPSKKCMEASIKAHTGLVASEETRRKLREKLTCPYCGKTGGKSKMKTYHFDNCLDNPANDREEVLERRKRKEKIECPHCEKKIDIVNAKIYHFDNCKFNPKNKDKNIHKRGKQSKLVCPHCKKEGGVGAMKRYHFDNCALNPVNTCPHCKTGCNSPKKRNKHFDNCKFKRDYDN